MPIWDYTKLSGGGVGKNLPIVTASDALDAATTTTSDTEEDITGLTTSITLNTTGAVVAIMTLHLNTSSGNNTTVACAVQIDGTNGQEIKRFLSGTNDDGSLTCIARKTGLTAGAYTVKGVWHRDSGTATIQAVDGQIVAFADGGA